MHMSASAYSKSHESPKMMQFAKINHLRSLNSNKNFEATSSPTNDVNMMYSGGHFAVPPFSLHSTEEGYINHNHPAAIRAALFE